MLKGRLLSVVSVSILALCMTTGYVLARPGPQTATEPVGIDAKKAVTFRVRIQNISAEDDAPTLFSPGLWVLHREPGPFFSSGTADRSQGLEALAEDGDPAILVASLRAQGLRAGVFDTPVCADTPGPLPSSKSVEFGNSFEFEVVASPETPFLSFATMLVQSNALFLAPSERGITLFDEKGSFLGIRDVTSEIQLWDAGTEANEQTGLGSHQATRQPSADIGPDDMIEVVRPVDDGFGYAEVPNLVRVTIVPILVVNRDHGRVLRLSPDYSLGERFRIGDVQWRALSAEYLGHELRNQAGDRQSTDGRYVKVRFEFLNLGSDPLEFEAVEDLHLRDNEGRTHEHFRVSVFPLSRYPREFIEDNEECFGGWLPYVLKPNILTTCTTIFEVRVDATDLHLVLSTLDGVDPEEGKTVDLNLPSTRVHSLREDVWVGDVRWQILSAEDVGHVLESQSNRVKTKNRYITVRFQLTNKGSTDREFSGAVLRDSRGREYEREKFEFIEDNERCMGGFLGPYVLKPNIIRTCKSIYEVSADATDLVFIANDLNGSENGAEVVDLGLSNEMPLRFYLIEEDVRVGDICWRVLSVEELGQELKSEDGKSVATQGRFLQTQFQLLNLSSKTLGYEGVTLRDSRGRGYEHFGQRLEFINDKVECPPSLIPPNRHSIEPNTPTICTSIHDVAKDAKNFTLWASDLEGYETAFVALPNVKTPTPMPIPTQRVSPGTYVVAKEISPGVYKGEAPADAFCKWARLNEMKEDPESIIAMGLREGQFYVEVQASDVGFTTECELVPIGNLIPRDPLLTEIPPGIYIVGLDIGPGSYKGKPDEDLFCFWQRLNNFREDEASTIEWDIPGDSYVVEIAPSDYAVEFACPVQKVE